MNAATANQKEDVDSSSDSSDDPLDSFMADIEASSAVCLYCVEIIQCVQSRLSTCVSDCPRSNRKMA